jgi:hypothetical protein
LTSFIGRLNPIFPDFVATSSKSVLLTKGNFYPDSKNNLHFSKHTLFSSMPTRLLVIKTSHKSWITWLLQVHIGCGHPLQNWEPCIVTC